MVSETVSPRWTAFLARSPAASMTEGLEVLVQEVMAAMTTDPLCSVAEAGVWFLDCETMGRGSGVGRSEIISCSSTEREIWADWAH
jgi:hypothetical protein